MMSLAQAMCILSFELPSKMPIYTPTSRVCVSLPPHHTLEYVPLSNFKKFTNLVKK